MLPDGAPAVHQRPALLARERLDGEPRRLARRDERVVLKEDGDVDVRIRADAVVAHLFEPDNADGIAGAELGALEGGLVVNENAAPVDGLLAECAARRREPRQ